MMYLGLPNLGGTSKSGQAHGQSGRHNHDIMWGYNKHTDVIMMEMIMVVVLLAQWSGAPVTGKGRR